MAGALNAALADAMVADGSRPRFRRGPGDARRRLSYHRRTIMNNNCGVFGVAGSATIINRPEVAIIGIGRIIDRPWMVGRQPSIRKVAQLTLAFDHRVCDGGTAGGFLRLIADRIESPVAALSDL
jgi:pyruvate/2-oxoglutarate dehydrogenase complex dihydrolipoamide acyltransferase (E2) component